MRGHYLQIFSFIFLFACCLGCGNGLGEKIVVDGTEIYYDSETITKAEVDTLGKCLQEQEFTDGTEKAVQLQRDGDKLVFKMVLLPEFLESGELEQELKLMCLQMSEVFDGQKIECHACDNQMISQKKMVGLYGKKTSYAKSDLYYNHLSPEQLTAVKEVLDQLGFDEFEGSLFFGKSTGGYEFRMICTPDFQQDEELQKESKIWQDEFSKAIGGEATTVMLCDEYFDPVFTRQAQK